MPDVAFVGSRALTLGVEEEFLLVDAIDGLSPAPRADQLLDGDWNTIASPGGWLQAELLRSSIELATAPSLELAQLEVDLLALRAVLVHRAAEAGAHLVATGLHPDLAVTMHDVSPTEAHRPIAELHERVGTLADQSTHSLHVHVGVPTLADAVRVMDAVAAHVPLLVAITGNSPVAHGVRTPWRSTRAELLRRALWAGPTPRFRDASEYATVHALHELENTAAQRFLWEVAPVPALGTVELRVCDAQRDPAMTLGVAALVQGIAAYVLDGGVVARPNESLERHNRWSAVEFGAGANFLAAGRRAPVPVPELLAELLELIRPYASVLGSEPWLVSLEHALDEPPVDALIAAFDADGVAGLLERARV